MSTNLDAMFKTDARYEKEGIDVRYTEETVFRIRRYGSSHNSKYKKAIKKYLAPYAKQIEKNTIDSKVLDDALMKSFIEGCLVSWEGVEIDGEKKECTFETALELFKELPDLYEDLLSQAQNMNNFKEQLDEEELEDLGNS